MDLRTSVALAQASLMLALPLSAHAQDTAPTTPKVVVVVSGDPDAALRDAAAGLERALSSSGQVTMPEDPGLRAALRGEPAPAEDDGLGRARVERRRLGWSEERDGPVLSGIAERTGAVAVVVVRRHRGALEAVVFDGRAGAFYDGALPLPADDATAAGRFVAARARAAATRSGGGTAADAQTAAGGTTDGAHGSGADTAADTAAGPTHAASTHPHRGGSHGHAAPNARAAAHAAHASHTASRGVLAHHGHAPAHPPHGSWFSRNWPFLLGAVVIGGAAAYIAVSSGSAPPTTPVLRFHTGN